MFNLHGDAASWKRCAVQDYTVVVGYQRLCRRVYIVTWTFHFYCEHENSFRPDAALFLLVVLLLCCCARGSFSGEETAALQEKLKFSESLLCWRCLQQWPRFYSRSILQFPWRRVVFNELLINTKSIPLTQGVHWGRSSSTLVSINSNVRPKWGDKKTLKGKTLKGCYSNRF